MNPAEQTVTWLITLGVLESPKKSVSDPEAFLQTSLRDGAVLCRLLERLRPGTLDRFFPEPRSDSDFQKNIAEFLKGLAAFGVEPFEVSDLLQGLNFSKVLNSLVALNKATEVSHSFCSCAGLGSFDSLNTQGRSSKLLLPQYRSLDMSEGSGCGQPLVKARFPFQQTNEDELSFSKGDIIVVRRQEEGGWWEGSLNGKTGWFPSNYVRELKGSDKPKSGTLKSPPKGFDTSIISKTYYNVVLQNILEAETEYSRELQSLLGSYLRSLQPSDRLSSGDISHIQANLEEISTFQQMLVQSLDDQTKLPENQQRIGGFFLSLMPQMKTIYVSYCSNHPSAVGVLTRHSEELGGFMEMSGFIYQGRMPLSGMLISRIEDGENWRNAFEISGQSGCRWRATLPSHTVTSSRHSEARGGSSAYHTLPHLSSCETSHSAPSWGPLEPPSSPKPWSLSCLRPAPPLRPSAALCFKEDMSKSPKNMKKLLPKRKPERKPSEEDVTVRKSTAALEEDAQILKVIEAYCTSAKTRQTLNSTWQGTDLMHNHVLADGGLAPASLPGNQPCSDQSEDSDYDSIWTAHSHRTASFSRKMGVSPDVPVERPPCVRLCVRFPRSGETRIPSLQN
uniref:Osteoclast-stimulating factor 1 n=1 Tax=Oryzias sinensis TaxID=183150 RepID=A0A8C8DQL6_9TELE